MNHGTRKTYRSGCACRACRSAEASYRAHLRRQHARGHIPLGAHVSPVETRQLLTRMLLERFTRGQIARLLGLKRPRLELHTETAITMRTKLNIRRLYRLRVQGDDRPHV